MKKWKNDIKMRFKPDSEPCKVSVSDALCEFYRNENKGSAEAYDIICKRIQESPFLKGRVRLEGSHLILERPLIEVLQHQFDCNALSVLTSSP